MTETTTLNRSWLIRMVIITAVVLGFSVWGYYDAAIVYPKRGERYAEFALKEYLTATEKAGTLQFASVSDPKMTLATLQGSGRGSEVDVPKYQWLNALSVIGKLDATHTTFDDPSKRLETLRAEWGTSKSPKPLSNLDIPTQWLIMGVCGVIGIMLVISLVRAASLKYQFDPSSSTLTLPGNHAVTPSDLEEVDKRKWHKYLVYLKIKPGHATLGGKEIKLDLLRYARLESWVLAMEAIAFPETAKPVAPSTEAGSQLQGESGNAGQASGEPAPE
jgi:hypothetical protein